MVVLIALVAFVQLAVGSPVASSSLSSYYNPILPGWHSDPSCIFVPEEDNTFFCATSTFLITPGIPIHASKDLVNWKLVSHVLNRPKQVTYFNENTTGQNDGIYAPTLRYHEGTFYLITVFTYSNVPVVSHGLIFKTTNPYEDASWSVPVHYVDENADYDPDLFWDTDGTVYMASTNISISTLDLDTGTIGPIIHIWDGAGGPYPEGPHIYLKDGYYYLLIAEGGTELGHSVMIARSKTVTGPYESYEGNPILTAKGTDDYFQTVGHADLFQDGSGNWWSVALSTRSGPEWKNYPMGRETVLAPVTWKTGEWPSMQPVEGVINGWPLPPRNKSLPGSGPFLGEPDVVDFAPGSSIPAHFATLRFPAENAFAISTPGHPYTLRLKPSRSITTNPYDVSAGMDGLSLLMRVQTDTLFTYRVDVSFAPKALEEEVGVTVFLGQRQHIDFGIVNLPSTHTSKLQPHLRLRNIGTGNYKGMPINITAPIQTSWSTHPITLQIQAKNDTHYTFSAISNSCPESVVIGSAPATIVSGGTGPFVGSLVGVYATANNMTGTTESYISKWRYTGNGQKIDKNTIVPSY